MEQIKWGKLSKVPSKEGRVEMSSFATRVPFVNAKLTSTPSAHNPVYNYPKRSKCPTKCTRKTFTTVWQLHMHLQYHHKNEGNRNQISIALAEEVIRDMKKWLSRGVANSRESSLSFMILEIQKKNGLSVNSTC